MIPRPVFLSLFAALLLVQIACFPNATFAFSENEGFASSGSYSISGLTLDSNPCAAGTPCDDGDPCTENDVCDGNGNCVGTPKSCDDGNPNTIDSCDGDGNCVFTFLPAGTPCNDGDPCTTNDVANGSGGCFGTAIVCDDGNPCTTDTCDPFLGCVFVPNAAGTPCDDGNPCTENDACDGFGGCTGTPIECPPSTDPCFVNTCLPGIGCTPVPVAAGTPCDDGDPCTENDVCDGNGNCVGTPKSCDDGNPNTIDSCDGDGNCVFTFLPAGTPCNDGDPCTTNDVANGSGGCFGTAIVCDDGNPCTTDTCDPFLGCVFVPNAAGTPCDDGNPCTENDACDGFGGCTGTPIECPPSTDPCFLNTCLPGIGCTPVPVAAGTPCDDGDPCTENDVCDGNGNCVGTPKSCDDGNPNTIDSCDGDGNCVFTFLPAGTPCNDGDPCTTNDVANGSGGCFGTAIVCDDGNPCTTDTCDPFLGCVFVPNAAGTPCDDGNPCTENDACDGFGDCTGTPIECPPSTDPCFINTCVPGIGCTPVPVAAGTLCDDGDPCTENDVCDGNGNCVGTPKSCDDGNPNTIDSCDGDGNCVFTFLPAGTPCNDGDLCTTNDVANGSGGCFGTAIVCDDGNPCTTDTCAPFLGCVFVPNAAGTPCDDGNPCTTNDVCDGNGNCIGIPISCDDGNPNTIDTCDENGICVFTPLPAGTLCNDGNACTVNDVADGTGGCSGTPIFCDDNDPCTTDSCDPIQGCMFIPNEVGTPCDDGNPNTTDTTIQPDCTCGGGVPTCSIPFPAVDESSLVTSIGPSSVSTQWSSVPGQIGCQIQVRLAGGPLLGSRTVGGPNADGFNIPLGVLQPSSNYEWRVRCGCSQTPLIASPFTAWQPFSTASGVSLESSPNPTEGISNVIFKLVESDQVTLEVYDMNGRLVDALYTGIATANEEYRLEFDGGSLPNGIYIYRLTTTHEVINRRFMIAK